MNDDFTRAQLHAHQATVDLANAAMNDGRLDAAKTLFGQALEELAKVEPPDDATRWTVMASQSSIHEALGVIASHLEDLTEAEHQYGLSLELRRGLDSQGADSGGFDVRLPQAVTHLNLAGVLANQERMDEAHTHAMQTVELVAAIVESSEDEEANPQLDLLLMTALQSVGMILAAQGRFEDANEAFEQGLTWARGVLMRGVEEIEGAEDADGEMSVEVEHLPEFLPSYAQMLSSAALVRHNSDEHSLALEMVTEAAQIGQALVEATEDEEAVELYLNAQFGVMQYAAAAGTYDRAEDALFKALALAPGIPELVELGVEFYEGLLAKDDATLEAGGLPREEIVESLAELRETGSVA